MNLKQKIILIIIIITSLVSLFFINRWNIDRAESTSLRIYAQGLEEYKNHEYTKAYTTFKKVSSYSSLKPVAIYRQAKAAEKMGNPRLVVKHYKKLIRLYPDFSITHKIKYLIAQKNFELNSKTSKREFKNIIKKYPNSEYAIASNYYLGLIQVAELSKIKNPTKLSLEKQKAEDYFRTYLKEAPAGRFAIYSIDKLKELKQTNLSSEDNLLIARSYYTLGEFKAAKSHYDRTDPKFSWVDIVKNAYELKEYGNIKTITEKGLLYYTPYVDKKEVYKAIDLYLQTANSSRVASIKHLKEITVGKTGEDYLEYLTCTALNNDAQLACYNNLYQRFPDGQFSAEALFQIFLSNINGGRYKIARSLGKTHLTQFKNTNSTPAVMFWLGKLEEKSKHYENARKYYSQVINKYPDSYYAYRGYLDLNRITQPLISNTIEDKPVVFPYKKSKDNNLVLKLALLKDYALVNEICKNDEFVQSWLAYQNGEYNKSVLIARDAMDKLEEKPPKSDFRWRLVYQVHYYETIKKYARYNNPILLLSIIKEESHFDPNAKSAVGAIGLMQIMPKTADEVRRNYGIDTNNSFYMFDPKMNIQIGSLYYSTIKNMNGKNDIYAILAYNGGIGAVSNWRTNLDSADIDEFVEKVPYFETKNYLKKVLRTYWNYVRIYG